MDETYTALKACALSRIEAEWHCGDTERCLLRLIVELSYGLGQSWCVVPNLADFAKACGTHKSTVSRALRAAVQKGYLQILSRRHETLYCVLTATREVQDDLQEQEAARARLVEMNLTRLRGQADVDGQARLPGVFENEETAAPAAAFSALVETPSVRPSSEEPLERLMRTFERRRIDAAPPEAQSPRPGQRPQRMELGSYESQWAEMIKGLGSQVLHCLEQIREECRHRKGGEAEFFQWRWKWRQRAQKHPHLYLEAAGVCKALRLESGKIQDSPGAFIYRSVETALKMSG